MQQKIVANDREQTSVLLLAGPNSGKTRVLAQRIADLTRVRREDRRSILVLTYNRQAAAEVRARPRHLIGDDGPGDHHLPRLAASRPVRGCAEVLALSVEMANESPLSVWRLRKMQVLISATASDPSDTAPAED